MPRGRRTQIVELSGRTTTYGYDDLNRLLTETISDPVNADYSASYSYDAVGNRVQSIVDGVTTAFSYDDNDRLLQHGGTTYSYDDNGNTLTETLDGNTKRYAYNANNQLIEVDSADGITRYQYNNDGIRTGQTTGLETTSYVVDSNRNYAQVLKESVNGTESVSYTYGDDLVSQTRDAATHHYHYDGLGSTRYLSDASGILTDSYDYEAFGQLLNETGSTENNYRFAGEQLDLGLDQYYLRARYYNQYAGRFTQMDTWMGNNSDPMTLHKYLYANANPVMFTDPSGNVSLAGVSIGMSISIALVLTDNYVANNNPMSISHRYSYDTNICKISNARCTKEFVFEALRIYPAPMTTNVGPVKRQEKNNLCFFGYFCQKIIHDVYPSEKMLRNTTLPGHIFWKGIVERRVIEKHGWLVIRSDGSGTNTTPLRWTFNHGAAFLGFELPDYLIKIYVESKI